MMPKAAYPIMARATGPPRVSNARLPGVSASVMSGLQVVQNGEYAAVVAVRRHEVELAEDAADVLFDGTLRHHHGGRDAGVGATFGHQPQDLPLARGQPLQRTALAAAGKQL